MNPLQDLSAVEPEQRPTWCRPFGEFGYRFLAEGDSWFTIGALNPLKNANLLFEMRFGQSACAVNCATPGDTLRAHGRRSAATRSSSTCCAGRRAARLGRHAAVLRRQRPDRRAGRARPRHAAGAAPAARGRRVGRCRAKARRATSATPAGRPSARYLKANLDHMRRAARCRRRRAGAPIFLHGYAVPTPRPAPAELGHRPLAAAVGAGLRHPARPTTRRWPRC